MFNENPYASPIDTSRGTCDWSLAKRMLYAFLGIAMLNAAVLCMNLYQVYRTIPKVAGVESEWDRFVYFFMDWSRFPLW